MHHNVLVWDGSMLNYPREFNESLFKCIMRYSKFYFRNAYIQSIETRYTVAEYTLVSIFATSKIPQECPNVLRGIPFIPLNFFPLSVWKDIFCICKQNSSSVSNSFFKWISNADSQISYKRLWFLFEIKEIHSILHSTYFYA